jgi:predicted RNA-binding Zn ribbon-like protein
MDNHSPALFLGDAMALDFLNSVATPIDTPIEWIEDGAGLMRWLEQAGLVPRETLESMRAQSLPGELDKIADQARNLREWFRSFVHARKGKPLTPDVLVELELLNRLLERDEGFNRVVARKADGETVLAFQQIRKWRSPEALLLPLGETLGRFVCTEDFSNVKACEGPACTLLFADHTRGHRRRWCSMALCGNRAKQAAHRQRLKDID